MISEIEAKKLIYGTITDNWAFSEVVLGNSRVDAATSPWMRFSILEFRRVPSRKIRNDCVIRANFCLFDSVNTNLYTLDDLANNLRQIFECKRFSKSFLSIEFREFEETELTETDPGTRKIMVYRSIFTTIKLEGE